MSEWLDESKKKEEAPVRIFDDLLTPDRREEWRKAIKERIGFWREKLQGPPEEMLDFVMSRGRRIDVKIKREKDGTLVIQGHE